jgi:hypothetical protein
VFRLDPNIFIATYKNGANKGRMFKEHSSFNTCVPYMPSNTTVILVSVLFYHGYMFRRLIGPSSGYSGSLHGYYQTIYIFTITITLWKEISYFTYTRFFCLCSWAVESIWLFCFMLYIGWGLAYWLVTNINTSKFVLRNLKQRFCNYVSHHTDVSRRDCRGVARNLTILIAIH